MSKGMSPAAEAPVTVPDPIPAENESFSSAAESIPVPLFAGQVKIAGRFWSPIYGQRTQQAASGTGKK